MTVFHNEHCCWALLDAMRAADLVSRLNEVPTG